MSLSTSRIPSTTSFLGPIKTIFSARTWFTAAAVDNCDHLSVPVNSTWRSVKSTFLQWSPRGLTWSQVQLLSLSSMPYLAFQVKMLTQGNAASSKILDLWMKLRKLKKKHRKQTRTHVRAKGCVTRAETMSGWLGSSSMLWRQGNPIAAAYTTKHAQDSCSFRSRLGGAYNVYHINGRCSQFVRGPASFAGLARPPGRKKEEIRHSAKRKTRARPYEAPGSRRPNSPAPPRPDRPHSHVPRHLCLRQRHARL